MKYKTLTKALRSMVKPKDHIALRDYFNGNFYNICDNHLVLSDGILRSYDRDGFTDEYLAKDIINTISKEELDKYLVFRRSFHNVVAPTEEHTETQLYITTMEEYRKNFYKQMVDKVIFDDRNTIILWKDNTKTIAKCNENDEYDKEKGILYAILKKVTDKEKYDNILYFIDSVLKDTEEGDNEK